MTPGYPSSIFFRASSKTYVKLQSAQLFQGSETNILERKIVLLNLEATFLNFEKLASEPETKIRLKSKVP